MSGKLITVDFANKKVLSISDSVDSPPTPERNMKFNVFSRMIAEKRTSLFLDPRHPEVSVPEHLKNSYELQIDWSLKFGLLDFEYDYSGVRGTLSFNRQPFYVSIPWDAVFLMVSGNKKQIFLDSYPKELLGGQQTIKPDHSLISEEARTQAVKESHEPSRKNPQRLEVSFGKRISRAVHAWLKYVLSKSLRG